MKLISRDKKNIFGRLQILSVLFGMAPVISVLSAESFTLEDVIAKVSQGTPATEEFRDRSDAASSRVSVARSKYFPEIGLEGGYEKYRWNEESKSSPFAYGYARWNLFNGFRDHLSLKQAAVESGLADFESSLSRRITLADATSKFYEVLYFQKLIELKTDALTLNFKQKDMAKRKRISGITSLSDETEFSLRSRILESDLAAARGDLAQALRELDALAGGGNQFVEKVPYGELILPLAAAAEENTGFGSDLSKSAGIRRASYEAEASALSPAATYGNWLPKVDLEATHGQAPYELQQLSVPNQTSVLLKVNFSLFNGLSTRAAQREAIALKSAAAKRLDQARIAAYAEIPSILSKLKTLRLRIGLEVENLSFSEKYYELTLREYQRGIKNSPDLAGASDRVFETRSRKLGLLKEYLQILTALQARF